MAIEFKGEKPGKFWYFRQYARGLFKTFRENATQGQARLMRRDGLISATGLAVGATIASVEAAAAIPFLVTFGPFVAGAAGLAFGLKSYLGYRRLKKSPVVYNYVRDQEKKWVEKKSRPGFLKRLANLLKKPFTRGRTAAAKAAANGNAPAAMPAQDKPAQKKKKFLFFFNRSAAPAAPAAAASATSPEAAAAPAPREKTPAELRADAERAEAARARAEARARRKTQSHRSY